MRRGGALKVELASFLVIVAAAVAAPLLAALIGRVIPFPLVVVELVLGILIGPQVLGLAPSSTTWPRSSARSGSRSCSCSRATRSSSSRIRGTPLRLALIGWAISLVLAYSLAGVLHATGLIVSGLLVGSAMATTAIGTLMPILRDNRAARDPLRAAAAGGRRGRRARADPDHHAAPHG